MKKFKEIMATMLAVVLAVAAVVMYASTVSYAEDHTLGLSLDTSGNDRWYGSKEYILLDGEKVTLNVTKSGYSGGVYIDYYYNSQRIYREEIEFDGDSTTGSKGLSYYDTTAIMSRNDIDVPEKLGLSFSAGKDDTGIIVKVNLTDASSAETSTVNSVSSPAHTHTWKYGTIFDATEDTDGLEGYYCSCGANKETTVIPSITAIYKNRYTQMDQAGKGEVITLKMGEWNTYSKEFMQHLISATERGVTVKLDYKYEKKNYVTTVPAGTTMELAYDYYGPLFIQSLFETTQLN